MEAKVFLPVFFSVVSVIVVAGAGVFQYVKNQQDTVPLSVDKKSIRRNQRPQFITYRNTTRNSNLQSRRSTTQSTNNLQPSSTNIAVVNSRFNNAIPDNRMFTLTNRGASGDCFYSCVGFLLPQISNYDVTTAQHVRNAIVLYIANNHGVYNKYQRMYQEAKHNGGGGDAFGPNIMNTVDFNAYLNDVYENHPYADQITLYATANRYNTNIAVLTKRSDDNISSITELTWRRMKRLVVLKQLEVGVYEPDQFTTNYIFLFLEDNHYQAYV